MTRTTALTYILATLATRCLFAGGFDVLRAGRGVSSSQLYREG